MRGNGYGQNGMGNANGRGGFRGAGRGDYRPQYNQGTAGTQSTYQATPASIGGSQPTEIMRNPNLRSSGPPYPRDGCMYCAVQGHMIRDCQTLQQDVNSGFVGKNFRNQTCYRNKDGHLHLLLYVPGYSMREEALARRNKERGGTLLKALSGEAKASCAKIVEAE